VLARGQLSVRKIDREDIRQGGQSSGRTNVRGTFVRDDIFQIVMYEVSLERF
jgi:hypothetical protein